MNANKLLHYYISYSLISSFEYYFFYLNHAVITVKHVEHIYNYLNFRNYTNTNFYELYKLLFPQLHVLHVMYIILYSIVSVRFDISNHRCSCKYFIFLFLWSPWWRLLSLAETCSCFICKINLCFGWICLCFLLYCKHNRLYLLKQLSHFPHFWNP